MGWRLMTKRLPKSVNLRGTTYRVQESEGLIVFSEEEPVWGCQARFTFERRLMVWFVDIQSTGGITANTIVEADRLVSEAYGENFKPTGGKP